MAEVQTPAVSSSKDNALLALSIVAILGGIAAFYWYDELALVLRIGMVVLGLAAGAGLLWLSSYGREFVLFAQAARVELRKVVWPTRDETTKTTIAVVIFVTVAGLFFWVLDLVLAWATRFWTTPGGS